MKSREIWQGIYNKEYPWKNVRWLSMMLCFFGSHKMMPIDEKADNLQCDWCEKRERFYSGFGYK